jgi:glycosyltransferase involved in cell wall biosynthesis
VTQPLVSVGIITYNHAPYIAQAIEGALQQKVSFPFEVVIGEDCSTDGTRGIVFEYQRRYPELIRVITSDENIGAVQNSYRTGKAYRGKYVAFCEGDDYWHSPDKLQKQVEYLEVHPECGLVLADCDVFQSESNEFIRGFSHSQGFTSSKMLTFEEIVWGEMSIFTCTAVFQGDLYRQLVEGDPYLYQSGYFLMDDRQLWAELARISQVHYMSESLATYRSLADSATKSSKDRGRALRFAKSCFEMRLYLCDKYNLDANTRKKEELGWCDSSLRLAFHEKNAALAMEVKKRKESFTWKEAIRYCGATHPTLQVACGIANLSLKLFARGLRLR